MIRLLTPFSSYTVKIDPNETPKSLHDKIEVFLNTNFTYTLQETQTGRILPEDEVLIDEREYYLNPSFDL
jgi:hypothetical protein